ncbi:MAG: FIST N-terminal domain-containing protein, partial [Pseudomonadota bacterium]
MDGGTSPYARLGAPAETRRPENGFDAPIVRRAHAPAEDADAAARALSAGLGDGPFALIAVFVSPEGDIDEIGAGLGAAFPGATLIGCTTAGELSPEGYAAGEAVAVGLPSSSFSAFVTVIDKVSDFDAKALAADLMSARAEQAQERPDWVDEFAFLMVDGLSLAEDRLTAALSEALGPVPFFGGSAGDGLAFNRTLVLAGGASRTDAAVVALIRTACRVKTFRLD